ncbi:LytTR family transcriptional regulator DNA-binding domain-containing protein [Paenibacillus daejeonensis]|uniref:LytTR family transcriptional regulator DNA-binding domain-containing protein n=1 Tax=Paenibacillus daejeonensis TaxID=135193 RepID=UPI0003747C58|nr:LytTR family transcriptional regulator DNA-binding domain-containing protein [Paenibacillus daejeonensis]
MSLTIQMSSIIKGNTVLLPDIDVAIEPGKPIAIQSDIEWLEPFYSSFLKNASSLLASSGQQAIQVPFVYLQSDGLYARLTPRQQIRFWSKLSGQRADESNILEICDLAPVADKRIKHLTGQEHRRLHYARSLVMPSPVCLFDQPILHADRQTKQAFFTLLAHLSDRHVIVTSTSLEEAIQLGKPYRLNERGLHALSDALDQADKAEQTDQAEDVLSQPAATPFKLQKITAKAEDKIILFDPLEIDYVESSEGQSKLYVNSETFDTPIPLKELEQRLSPLGFFRCHRSYLVNLQRVREIIVWSKNSYSLSLDDRKRTTVPLSKGNYATLKEMLQM